MQIYVNHNLSYETVTLEEGEVTSAILQGLAM